MKAEVEIIFNKNLEKNKKGDKIKIELNGYWRNRIKDGDISLVIEKNKNTSQDIKKKLEDKKEATEGE